MGEPPRGGEVGDSRAEIEDAQIRGDVVQARDVSGGVHFHAAQGDGPKPRVIPRQLPASVRVFINRQPEIRALTRLTGAAARPASGGSAPAATVVVITGSAGVGKTALALHWAHRVRDRFPDGELYVNLRGFDEGPPVSTGAVLDRFLRDLGVSPQGIPADTDERAGLFRSLAVGRRILIVLDNAADADQVRPLLPGGSGPFMIVTSRNQLGGLAVWDGAERIRLDTFAESDAVGLLRRVTRTGGRRDAPGDLAELARVCARLPLALRVAAEHAVSRPTMRLAELIADLRDASLLWDALSIGEGPGEGVRAVFAWSYRDLPLEAARMFRVLGLHSGPDIGLSAAAVACGVPVREARRALDILIGAFLLEAPRSGRYQLHDLLRAYALDQARAIDSEAERREVLDRILRWYTSMALNACEVLYPGRFLPVQAPDMTGLDLIPLDSPAIALDWFGTERTNMVASTRAALEAGLPRRAWELAMALSPVHASRYTFDDWSVLSEFAVTAAEETGDSAALAAALDNRGSFLFRRRLLDDATAAHTRALSIRREIGDQKGVIESLNKLGLLGMRTRELSQAATYFADVIQRARDIGDSWWEGVGRMNLADIRLEAGHAEETLEIVTPLPQLFAGFGYEGGEGYSLVLLSQAHRALGDNAAALTAIGAALRLAEDTVNRAQEAFWLIEAARVHLALGDTGEAMRCCRMAASLQRQIGDHGREAMALDCTGEVMLAMGRAGDACAFHREAARMFRRLGDEWQEGVALAHLAACEAVLGREDADREAASREEAARALALIGRFTDDRAEQLKADLRARLG